MLNLTRLSALGFVTVITVAGLSFNSWSARARSQKRLAAVNALAEVAPPAPPNSLLPVTASVQLRDARVQSADENRLETEILTITSTGFEPAEITRPAGPFILALHNQSGEAGATFRIDRVRGNKLIEVRMPRQRRAMHQQLNPPPGEYLLSIVDHPEQNCRITITSN